MGMDHPGPGGVKDTVSPFHSSCRKDHILVEDGLFRKAAQLQIYAPLIGGTYVGAEIRFDPQLWQVLPGL